LRWTHFHSKHAGTTNIPTSVSLRYADLYLYFLPLVTWKCSVKGKHWKEVSLGCNFHTLLRHHCYAVMLRSTCSSVTLRARIAQFM